jgi:hypothetical protein
VIGADDGAFLLQQKTVADGEVVINLFDKATLAGRVVGSMRGDLFAGIDSKSELPASEKKQHDALVEGLISVARERSKDVGARIRYRRWQDESKALYQSPVSADEDVKTILIDSRPETPEQSCRWDGFKRDMKDKLKIAPESVRNEFEADPWIVTSALIADRQGWMADGWEASPMQLLNPSDIANCVK